MGTAGRIEAGKRLSLGLLVAAIVVAGVLLTHDLLDDTIPASDGPGSVTVELGATRDADGRILLRVPRCAGLDQQIVRVSEADGPVVWELEADPAAPAHVGQLAIGEAPPAFDETVPLSEPLSPDRDYDVELLVTAPDVDLPPSLFGGAQTSFVPDDLDEEDVWVGRELVPPSGWQTSACPTDPTGE